MSNLDGRLRLNVLLDSPPLSASGFTLPLLVSPDVEFPNGERIRVYNTAREVAEDPTVGEATRALVSQAFSQNPKPAQIAIGAMSGGVGSGPRTVIDLFAPLWQEYGSSLKGGFRLEFGGDLPTTDETLGITFRINGVNHTYSFPYLASDAHTLESLAVAVGNGLVPFLSGLGFQSYADSVTYDPNSVSWKLPIISGNGTPPDGPDSYEQVFNMAVESIQAEAFELAGCDIYSSYLGEDAGELFPDPLWGVRASVAGETLYSVYFSHWKTLGEITEEFAESIRDSFNYPDAAVESVTVDGLTVTIHWSEEAAENDDFVGTTTSTGWLDLAIEDITDAGGGGAPESITETLDAMLATGVDWFGFSVLFFAAGQELRDQTIEAAQWAEANAKLFGHTHLVWGAEDPIFTLGDTDNALSDLEPYENTYTVVEYIEEGEGFPSFQGFQLLANRLSVNPDSPNGATIWSYVTLAGATPSPFTASQLAAVREKNGNVYSRFFGQPATGWGVQGNGQKTDLVVLKHWLKARSEESIAGLLLRESNRGSKIPYTDAGIVQVKSKVEEVLALAVANGHLTGGTTWTNFLTVAETPLPDRQNRVIRFTFGGVPTGAIEEVEATGYISFDEQSGISVEV